MLDMRSTLSRERNPYEIQQVAGIEQGFSELGGILL